LYALESRPVWRARLNYPALEGTGRVAELRRYTGRQGGIEIRDHESSGEGEKGNAESLRAIYCERPVGK